MLREIYDKTLQLGHTVATHACPEYTKTINENKAVIDETKNKTISVVSAIALGSALYFTTPISIPILAAATYTNYTTWKVADNAKQIAEKPMDFTTYKGSTLLNAEGNIEKIEDKLLEGTFGATTFVKLTVSQATPLQIGKVLFNGMPKEK